MELHDLVLDLSRAGQIAVIQLAVVSSICLGGCGNGGSDSHGRLGVSCDGRRDGAAVLRFEVAAVDLGCTPLYQDELTIRIGALGGFSKLPPSHVYRLLDSCVAASTESDAGANVVAGIIPGRIRSLDEFRVLSKSTRGDELVFVVKHVQPEWEDMDGDPAPAWLYFALDIRKLDHSVKAVRISFRSVRETSPGVEEPARQGSLKDVAFSL